MQWQLRPVISRPFTGQRGGNRGEGQSLSSPALERKMQTEVCQIKELDNLKQNAMFYNKHRHVL